MYRYSAVARVFPLLVGVALLATNALTAQGQAAGASPTRDDPPGLVVTVEWLARHAGDPRVRVIQTDWPQDSAFPARHIPGAQLLPLDSIAVGRDGNDLELRAPAELRAVLEGLGISDSSWVVVYGSPAWAAARTFFTLDYAGLRHVAVLNGGLTAWTAGGHALSADVPRYQRGVVTASVRSAVVDAQWVKDHLSDPHIVLIDTRSDSEYNGTMRHRGLDIRGHIPGARLVHWQALVGDSNGGELSLRDSVTLRAYFRERAGPGDSLVTYCHVGARASISYLVARYLGYPVHLYDGSYEDWAARGLPLRASDQP